MKNLLIVNNCTNAFCGLNTKFRNSSMHIGSDKAISLLRGNKEEQLGPLVTFLKHQLEGGAQVLFMHDSYTSEDEIDSEYLERFGVHCLLGSDELEYPEELVPIQAQANTIACQGNAFPIAQVIEQIKIQEVKNDLRILLLGFHTERRINNTANILRNALGFENVAVYSPFVEGLSKDAHYTALRYTLPDNLVKILNGIDDLQIYLEEDLEYLRIFEMDSVFILPDEIRIQLNTQQKHIIESICMHWSKVELNPLGGGFSGSALFLARGKQGKSETEPMVIKIDNHRPIQNEIRGYHLVKDLLGKHIPTFTFPVNHGSFSGIGMELAAMEGKPRTLQDFALEARTEYGLDKFLSLLDKVLDLLTARVYKNTLKKQNIAPYRHFMLHINQQSDWLKANLDNIQNHTNSFAKITDKIILNIFNLVRKNTDTINSSICIAHGDLNFANIIVDDQDNLWTIDWTHAGNHPIEIDFAKMENDLKFVLSKEMRYSDLPQLKAMEEHLLQNIIPCDLEELSDDLYFIKWDIRFKTIYKGVRRLRCAYQSLKADSFWLNYKIALLRYALHTLSFDKTRNAGECSPPQLWYTALSVESLCFDLMSDDYHLKIRSEKPSNYPNRFRVTLDRANWAVDVIDYSPPYFVAADLLLQDNTSTSKADPEDQWIFDDIIDWGTQYIKEDNGMPLNPRGRTGIAGRGNLWYWGSNPMLHFIPLRENGDKIEILLSTENEWENLTNIHIRRKEKIEEALNRASTKLGLDFSESSMIVIHQGYIYDIRQTDNAWVESKACVLVNDSVKERISNNEHPQTAWRVISPEIINQMYPSEAQLIRQAIEIAFEKKLLSAESVQKLLNKTG